MESTTEGHVSLAGRPNAAPPLGPSKWGYFLGIDRLAPLWRGSRLMELVEDLHYIDARGELWTARAGLLIDGASIPRPFWSITGGPFEGQYRVASIPHDQACTDRDRPWPAVHRMFYEAMRASGMGPPSVPRPGRNWAQRAWDLVRDTASLAQAVAMYRAVYHCGPRWPDPVESMFAPSALVPHAAD